MNRFIKIIWALLFLVKPLPAQLHSETWVEAGGLADTGDYGGAIRVLTQAVDSGEVQPGQIVRYEAQIFLWRRETGEGGEALERLFELPTRTDERLEAAANVMGDYFTEVPEALDLWFEAGERHPAWNQVAGDLAERLLKNNALEAAARVAGAQPAKCRSTLQDLIRFPGLSEIALASHAGDPFQLDAATWRVWLRLLESARGPETAVEAALMRTERDPDRVEFRCEASERLRRLGRADEALLLWKGRDGATDDRVYVERGECLYALGRINEAVETWLTKLDRENLRSGDVRTVARIFTDHDLNEEALQLLENPPTGEFTDYAKDIARLLFTLGRYRDAAETCAESMTMEGINAWSFDFIVGFGDGEESALQALEVVRGREEPLFGRIRLYLALSPWALSPGGENDGPLPHPWRERVRTVVLDERADRIVEEEILLLKGYFLRHPDAVNLLSTSGGLLPLEFVQLLGRAGLPELALKSALRFASFDGMKPDARGAIATLGLSYASKAALDAHGVEVKDLLALNPNDVALRWRAALFLLEGGRERAAAAILGEIKSGYGYGPDEDALLAARIEAALLLDDSEGAWELTGKSPEDLREPHDAELHYQMTLLQVFRLADELERDRAFDPSAILDWMRRYIAQESDDPRATDLLRLVLAYGFAEEGEGREAFIELVGAFKAGVQGDRTEKERRLGRALTAEGTLGAEATVQLADHLAEGGKYSEARTLLQSAIESGIEGTSDRALSLAAWIDANHLHDVEAAKADLTELIKGYPGSVLLEYARRGLGALD